MRRQAFIVATAFAGGEKAYKIVTTVWPVEDEEPAETTRERLMRRFREAKEKDRLTQLNGGTVRN